MEVTAEVLRKLEEKVTKRILDNIENIVETKCVNIWERLSGKYEPGPRTEILEHENKWLAFETEYKELNDKVDHIIGSINYISNEYDDFTAKIFNLTKQNQMINEDTAI